MTTEDYESRTDSVLAWKKAQKLGRFDPNAPEIEKSKIDASFKEVEDRGAWLSVISNAISNFSNKKVVENYWDYIRKIVLLNFSDFITGVAINGNICTLPCVNTFPNANRQLKCSILVVWTIRRSKQFLQARVL